MMHDAFPNFGRAWIGLATEEITRVDRENALWEIHNRPKANAERAQLVA
jgi:hypothetical protein